jgi:putative two-component system response regulator
MRSHVEIGVGICSPLRTLRAVIPVIRSHHERQDGSGYPDGLAGDQVPFLARVFQIADVFDAMTNDRPYRPAMSPEAAIATLRDEAAWGWWDTAIVEVFAGLLDERRVAVPKT